MEEPWRFCAGNGNFILANDKICRIHPPCSPSVWRAGQGAATMIAIPIPAAAEKGSPEGCVPLALSAQDRPPRRRTERQTLTHTSIIPAQKTIDRTVYAIRSAVTKYGIYWHAGNVPPFAVPSPKDGLRRDPARHGQQPGQRNDLNGIFPLAAVAEQNHITKPCAG